MYSSCGHLSNPCFSSPQSSIFACSSRASSSVRRGSACHNPWWFALCASFCLAPLMEIRWKKHKKPLRPNHAWQEKEKSWTEAILLPLSKYEFQKPAEICRMFIFWSSFPTWSLLSSRLRFASSSATAYHGMSGIQQKQMRFENPEWNWKRKDLACTLSFSDT